MRLYDGCRPLLHTIAVVLGSHSFAWAGATQCYAPDGTPSNMSSVGADLVLYSCPPGPDGFATCCVNGDFCQSNNLCYNLNGGKPVVFRQYCTDPTWGSAACSTLCRTSSSDNGTSGGGIMLSPCTDGKFCCGQNNNGCCDEHYGNYAVAGQPVGPGITYAVPTSDVVTMTSTATSTATITATLSPSETSFTNDESKNLSPGALAGIVIGALGALGLFALAGALYIRRGKSEQMVPVIPVQQEYTTVPYYTEYKPSEVARPRQELM